MALPKIGLQAVLELSAFERAAKQYTKGLAEIEKSTQSAAKAVEQSSSGMAKSLDEFFEKVFVQADKGSTEIYNSIAAIGEAWQKAGEPPINVEKFISLMDQGKSVTDAFKESLTQTKPGLEDMSSALKLAGGVAALFSTAIGTATALVKDAIKEYVAFQEEVRRVRFELGASAEEASGWARAAEQAGVSSTSLERAMTTVSKKMLDFRLAQIEGKDGSNQFTRALDALNISITNTDGTMKSATQVMGEVQQRFQELGPGAVTTGASMDIFGYAGRQLLPLLIDSGKSIEEMTARAEELGATLTESDVKAYEEWRLATTELNQATTGVKEYMARQWLPVLTELAKIATELIDHYRKFIAVLNAETRVTLEVVTGQTKITEIGRRRMEILAQLLGLENDAARQEHELAQARNEAAQDALLAAQAEEELAKQRAEVLQEMADLRHEYRDKLIEIELDFDRRWEDLMEKRRRQDIERDLREAGQREDLWLRHQQKLADIVQDSQKKRKEIEDDLAQKLARFDEDAARDREKALNKHLDNLWKIRNRYLDTVQEAARKNDAVAVVQAMRTQNREIRDENYRYAREQSDLEKDLEIKRRQIQEDAAKKKAEEEQDYQDKIKAAQDNYAQQLQLLEARLARERELLKLQREWEIDDFNKARARKLEDARAWYEKEKAELQAALAELGGIASQGIMNAGVQIAQAAATAVEAIAQQTVQAVEAVGRGVLYTGTTSPSGVTPAPTGRSIDEWLRRQTPGGYRQYGGIDVVNRPTTFHAGEAGAEIAAFIPLRGGTQRIEHSFGKMGFDFGGLPGGMNTSQVESIVYDAMTALAEALYARARG